MTIKRYVQTFHILLMCSVMLVQLLLPCTASAANTGYALVADDTAAPAYIPYGRLSVVPELGVVGYSSGYSGQQYDNLFYFDGSNYRFTEPYSSPSLIHGLSAQDEDIYGAVLDYDRDGYSDYLGEVSLPYLGRQGPYVALSNGEVYAGSNGMFQDGVTCDANNSVENIVMLGNRPLRTVTATDIDYDGSPNAIFASGGCGGNLTFYDQTIQNRQVLRLSDIANDFQKNPYMSTQPVVADFNGDSFTDVAVSIAYTNTLNQTVRKIVAYNLRDGIIWTYTGDYSSNMFAADFDNDNIDELILGDAHHVSIIENGVLVRTVAKCSESMGVVEGVSGSLSIVALCNSDSADDAIVDVIDPSTGLSRIGFPRTIAANKFMGPMVSVNVTKGSASTDIVVPTKKGLLVIDGADGNTLMTIDSSRTYDDVVATFMDNRLILVAQGLAENPHVATPISRNTYAYSISDPSLTISDTITPIDQPETAYYEYGFDGSRSFSFRVYPISQPDGGYHLVAADGGIFPFGDAVGYGSAGNIRLAAPVVGMARTPSGNGYWLVAADGGIFTYGDAQYFGSTGDIKLRKPIVGMAATPSGNGYWLVAADGGIFPFGDAVGYGSAGNMRLRQPIVGMSATPSGDGYWLVAADGGIFPFGAAGGYGSTGNIRLWKPIVGMTTSKTGNGYYLVASDGGIFPFGDAVGYGSAGNINLWEPIVGMSLSPSGNGYTLVAADGGIFTYGDARYYGSTGGINLAQPVVGIAQ